MSKLQVLIVDDEWKMRNLLRIYLTREGFDVKEASNGREALSMVKEHSFDIIILDVMMPDMDGWQVCEEVRETDNVAILMLTARSETKDKVLGLGIGADDYLTKPFEPEELLARVYSLIRRSTMTQVSVQQESILEFQDVKIHPEGREIYIHDLLVDFTQKEFDLFVSLARNQQRAYGRGELLDLLWGYDYDGDDRVVDTHVKNIRDKTRRSGLLYNPIQTVWGVGYKFNATGELK
ncbi:response regulator transcription factor [Paenibacillus macquariensis]|nr:response regulator transcription factor [Paenibacillus macquariensis]MEC0092595.1 response regulator transcription factor [Paenibacillus macquariensis]OAB36543.1 DNA-binding response regulator [Paenibacillus macquariensis subsp. macquariensis]